jgi:hypothetical protein
MAKRARVQVELKQPQNARLSLFESHVCIALTIVAKMIGVVDIWFTLSRVSQTMYVKVGSLSGGVRARKKMESLGDRFRTVVPCKVPAVLQVTGKFSTFQKKLQPFSDVRLLCVQSTDTLVCCDLKSDEKKAFPLLTVLDAITVPKLECLAFEFYQRSMYDDWRRLGLRRLTAFLKRHPTVTELFLSPEYFPDDYFPQDKHVPHVNEKFVDFLARETEVCSITFLSDNAALCINSGVKQAGFHRYRHLRVMTATSWFSSDRLEVDVSKLGQGYEEEKSRKNWQGYLIERRV